MLEPIKNELNRRHYVTLTSKKDWLQWSDLYMRSDDPTQNALSKLLANHTSIPLLEVQKALTTFITPEVITSLNAYEQQGTLSIQAMQQRTFAKFHDMSKLVITRSEWFAIINRAQVKHRHHVNIDFIINCLSSLRKVSFDSIVALLKVERPARAGVKRERASAEKETSSSHKMKDYFHDEDETNPLIANSAQATPNIQEALEATGVRTAVLSFASPEKGYTELKSTPGGRKVRPVCDVNRFSLFKHLTPYSKKPEEARVDLSGASAKAIAFNLPKLNAKRAEPVEFTATSEAIKERAGKRRRESQGSIMGASARDVFQAHGIEVCYEHKNAHHWAHLIAHFLCDSSEIDSDSDSEGEEVINLIASTAAANYNTLKTVELFIKDKLLKEDIEEIHIRVEPSFSGESIIPNLLTYKLTWQESNEHGMILQKKETFYINPQSYERINKCMLESIDVLRKVTAESTDTGGDEDLLDAFPPLPSM